MGKPKPVFALDPRQCRAGRALLGWSQADLSGAAAVNKRTILDFESGARQPYGRTLLDLREAMERAGVVFLADGEQVAGGPGVRLADRTEAPSVEDMLK